MSGALSYHAGVAAEETVASDYLRRGFALRESRWRGPGGEIDLIFEKAGALVFVEVKKAGDFARAAARITQAQIARIYASAGGYLATMPSGMDTETRFDAALVDATGAVEILENAFGL
ncbi:YraN family protein [Pseudoruegeria sp. HB172150]|uniref:YraN family protein n=1 Tax=Pseudoruegeria sp. HB172150 TaxID=2721164 RepID=UPI0015525C2B|nr:YraN family protein [Pseudoruegeria sp. HB172150]